jgi:flagellar hook-length control protein FliK
VGSAASPALPPATGYAAAPQAAIDQESTMAAATPGGAWSQALGAAAQATAGDAPGAVRPATAAHDPSAANQASLGATPATPPPADMLAAASAEARAVLRAVLPGATTNDAAAAAAAVPAAGQPARDEADLAAPAPPVALATPIDEPDFAAHLGAQVSLLAQGGVHKAELRLNPAHMGPVAVHITLDGTQARVEFGVDVQATRQAIEDGLPALAAAMREAGFTLSGGGVSQHPQGQARREAGQSGGDARPWPGSSGRDEPVGGTAALPTAALRRVSLGHLDLYA